MPRALEGIFRSSGCAVVGASANPKKAGHQILANMKAAGFAGRTLSCQPGRRGDTRPALDALLSSIAGEVQLVVIASPAATVPAIVEDLRCRMDTRGDIRGLVCSAAGFAEVGSPEGRAYQELLAAFCRNMTFASSGQTASASSIRSRRSTRPSSPASSTRRRHFDRLAKRGTRRLASHGLELDPAPARLASAGSSRSATWRMSTSSRPSRPSA